MILPALSGSFGILLLAAGTPRQATALFGTALSEPRRRALRIAGLGCLAFGFVWLLAGAGDGRTIVGWIGLLAVDALAVAIACSTIKPRAAGRSVDGARDADCQGARRGLSGLPPIVPDGSGGVRDQEEDA